MPGNVHEWTASQTSGGQPGASGYALQEWNAIAGGSLSPNPFPSYGTPAAGAWTSAQGIGEAYTSSTETNLRIFTRGGSWGSGLYTGVLTLYVIDLPGLSSTSNGFQVAR